MSSRPAAATLYLAPARMLSLDTLTLSVLVGLLLGLLPLLPLITSGCGPP